MATLLTINYYLFEHYFKGVSKNSASASVFFAKNRGQNRAFFAPILTPFLPSNHYMLWSNSIFCPLYHNSASESRTQRAPSTETGLPAVSSVA